MAPTIRLEAATDTPAITAVHRAAFGREEEARLVSALRAEGYARLSLVAEVDSRIVGHVLFSTLPIESTQGTVEALALAPLAVLPDHQRRGIGSALIRAGLRLCREGGHRVVIVVGDPGYYARFGFSAKLAAPLASPYAGEGFMGLELVPGALQGVVGEVRYPPPFEAV